ncbi:MAG: glutathione S-transferase family protein [Devosiaceae bacterium]|nr:glutathione S-transferase family protein [Devosiaceae bacterium]
MSDFHLISHHLCPYVQRAVIVLSEKQVAYKRTNIDLGAKPDWFLEISPLGRVPVLQTGGSVLFESQVIAEYLDEITPGSLHPVDPLKKAYHRSWIEFASGTLNSIAGFYSAPNVLTFEKKRLELHEKFKRIEQEIGGPFFNGKQFHMIDGVWGTVFRYLDSFDKIADFALLEDLAAIKIWRQAIMKRPSVIGAAPIDYSNRLEKFLINKKSHISTLI